MSNLRGISAGQEKLVTSFTKQKAQADYSLRLKPEPWGYLDTVLPTECRSWQDSMTRSVIAASAFFR